MSQNLKSRQYSRKGIKLAPKTFRQFKSAVNKVLWRKYHLRRDDLGISIADLKAVYADGKLSADAFVAQVVGK